MVSLFKLSFLGFFLFVIMTVQATPLDEPSKISDGDKTPLDYEQLYEFYKMMRVNPRLATVSNHDLILFLYRNFIHKNGKHHDDTIPTYSRTDESEEHSPEQRN